MSKKFWIMLWIGIILLGVGLGFLMFVAFRSLSYDNLVALANKNYFLDLSIITDDFEIIFTGEYIHDTNSAVSLDPNDPSSLEGNIYQEIIPLIKQPIIMQNEVYSQNINFYNISTLKKILEKNDLVLDYESSLCTFSFNEKYLEIIHCETENQVVEISIILNE